MAFSFAVLKQLLEIELLRRRQYHSYVYVYKNTYFYMC